MTTYVVKDLETCHAFSNDITVSTRRRLKNTLYQNRVATLIIKCRLSTAIESECARREQSDELMLCLTRRATTQGQATSHLPFSED